MSISNLTISFPSNPTISLDNLYYSTSNPTGGTGGTSATPEAGTFLLIGGGLAALARYRKAFDVS